MDVYQTTKDFAGPTATVIAAAAAAYVTTRIQRQNQELARARLKLDLFNQRYEVYAATRDLFLLLTQNPDLEDVATTLEMGRIYRKMAEAPFVSGQRAQAFVIEARAIANRWRGAKILSRSAKDMVPGVDKAGAVLASANALREVLEALERVETGFMEDLRVG